MSPALASISSPIARTVPSLPHIDNWSNRVPEDFSKLENRVSYLTTESNRHLEMHPNGTRGVKNYTEYCTYTSLVLFIYLIYLYCLLIDLTLTLKLQNQTVKLVFPYVANDKRIKLLTLFSYY